MKLSGRISRRFLYIKKSSTNQETLINIYVLFEKEPYDLRFDFELRLIFIFFISKLRLVLSFLFEIRLIFGFFISKLRLVLSFLFFILRVGHLVGGSNKLQNLSITNIIRKGVN